MFHNTCSFLDCRVPIEGDPLEKASVTTRQDISMSELHLDLCRQSTKHLHETISSLKENLRILEVFVTSGLSDDGKSKQGSSVALTNSAEGSQEGSGESHQRQQKKDEKCQLARFDRHQHCCCMCPTRLGRICCNKSMLAYHGRGGICCPANSVASSRRIRPVSMPRLNRTASLRRDTALERATKINSQKL